MIPDSPLRIAVDFDGTIVENRFPEIGPSLPGAFETLRELSFQGHKLILWTFRDGESLQEAVDFCLEHGIMFWAVNKSFPEENYNKYISRKIDAHFFIDDKIIGGFPGWPKIREVLLHGADLKVKERDSKKTIWKRIFT